MTDIPCLTPAEWQEFANHSGDLGPARYHAIAAHVCSCLTCRESCLALERSAHIGDLVPMLSLAMRNIIDHATMPTQLSALEFALCATICSIPGGPQYAAGAQALLDEVTASMRRLVPKLVAERLAWEAAKASS